ncbi:hypothetical protein DMK83_25900 [Vibrio parahaemolyticus]|nr:hypothetical protein [Vibrio parahaemolyticus]
MTKNVEQKKERPWVVPLVTTLIGIVVTLLVAWYQSVQNVEQAKAAEIERQKAALQNLVQIVEEHIINDTKIDLPRLARLSDFKTRDDNVSTPISVARIIEKAEFNIINSQYLDLAQKEKYKKSFDELYKDLSVYSNFEYEGRHSSLVQALTDSMNNGSNEEQMTNLARLLEAFNQDYVEIEETTREPKSILLIVKSLSDQLPLFLGVMVVLTILMQFFERELRKRARRRAYERMNEEELAAEILRKQNIDVE